MRTSRQRIAAILLVIGAAVAVIAAAHWLNPPSGPTIVASSGAGRLEKWGTLKVLLLSGAPYDRGVQHGTLLKEQVARVADRMRQAVDESPRRDELMARADALERQLLPAEAEEMRGVADGAGVDYDAVVLMNMAYELYEAGCSQFAATDASGTLVVGRNFEYYLPDVLSRARVLQVVRPTDGRPYLAPSFAGCVGVITGVNDRGIYAAVNAIPGAERSDTGVPSSFALRRLLTDTTTIGQAEALLASMPCAMGYNLMLVSSSERAYRGVEVGVTGSGDVMPESGFVVVTNHYTLPDMRRRILFTYRDDMHQEMLREKLLEATTLDGPVGIGLLKSVAVGSPRQPYLYTLHSLVWLPGSDDAWLSMSGLPATSGTFELLHPLEILAEGSMR